jgi:hypothetical protein
MPTMAEFGNYAPTFRTLPPNCAANTCSVFAIFAGESRPSSFEPIKNFVGGFNVLPERAKNSTRHAFITSRL